MLFAFGSRSDVKTFWQLGPMTNLPLLGATIVSGTLQLGTVLLPAGRSIFQTMPVSLEQWIVIAALSLVPVTVVEVSKLVSGARRKRNA